MADNGTFHNPMLYRSYADAKKTDFECMLYECKNAEDIPGYIERLIERVTLDCYYRPGNEEHVYIETGDWEQIRAEFIGMIFITVIGGLFDLVIAIPILVFTIGGIFMCIREIFKNTHCNCKCRKPHPEPRQILDLPHALANNDLSLVKKLTKYDEKKVSKKIHYKLQWTYPLHIAATNGDLRIAEYLLCVGTSISTNTQNDKTPLHLACKNGNVEMMNLLIKHGCLGIYNLSPGDQPVIINLLEKGEINSAQLLVEAGYPLHKQTQKITSLLPRIQNAEALSFIITELENPAPLQRICRTIIRKLMGNRKIQGKLETLSVSKRGMLPEILVKFLKLESTLPISSNRQGYYNNISQWV